MGLYTEFQIEESLKRTGRVMAKHLETLAYITNGLLKLEIYMLQKAPGGDGKAFLLTPTPNELIGLFVSFISCHKDYVCKNCIYGNVCLKKLISKLSMIFSQTLRKPINFAEIMITANEDLVFKPFHKEIVTLFQQYLIFIGKTKK